MTKKRKAFTLIELLIVIAIIGILFIVLVSKVDFATDKAKATGVQTDFRSFQLAFDTVAKENAGFNTFGWDTGDTNANGKRDNYDEGDANKDGKQDADEVWTGHKVYAETFTKVYSLVKPGTTGYDREALNRLETAINANLDPKLHITIKDDGEIVMANGAQDPWNKEYHGWYITNAESDKKDRGAIIMYSDGANNEFGSEHKIANGVVSITIPGNNKYGKDDYAVVSCYTYVNGYGEVKNITTGFSNNTNFLNNSNNTSTNTPDVSERPTNPDVNAPYDPSGGNNYLAIAPGLYEYGTNYGVMTMTWDELLSNGILRITEGRLYTSQKDNLIGDLVLPNDGSITELGKNPTGSFEMCKKLTSVVIPESVTTLNPYTFQECHALVNVVLPESLTYIDDQAFQFCIHLNSITIPPNVTGYHQYAFWACHSLVEIYNNSNCDFGSRVVPKEESNLIDIDGFRFYKKNGKWMLINYVGVETIITTPQTVNGENYDIEELAFWYLHHLTSVTISEGVTSIGHQIFDSCTNLQYVSLPDSVTTLDDQIFLNCKSLVSVKLPSNLQELPRGTFSGCNSLNNVVLPNGLTTIGQSAFSGCSNLTSLYIPSTVNTIGSSAFNGCTELTNVILPNSLSEVSEGLFKNCTKLQNVEIGENVTSIKNSVFSGCSSLKTIVINTKTPPTQSESSSYRIPNTIDTLYVPAESVETYKTHTQWSYLATKIQPISN